MNDCYSARRSAGHHGRFPTSPNRAPSPTLRLRAPKGPCDPNAAVFYGAAVSIAGAPTADRCFASHGAKCPLLGVPYVMGRDLIASMGC